MTRVLALTFTLALSCVLLVTPVRATVIIPADLTTLAREAAAIAHGRVVRVEARQGEGRRVERLVTLQVFAYFKGGWGNVVQFTVPGGSYGRYRTVMIGAPELDEGDEVVLFFGAREDVKPYVIGLHQGVFRVVADQATGKRLVVPPLIQGEGGSAEIGTVTRGDPSRRPLDLDEFHGRIATALAASSPSARPAKAGAAKAGTGAVPRSAR